ncbi:hypothetical protein M9Y10_030966 [Tritrichomonas musculus]|uniref:Amino acid transporter transmembrane domain-containing protein n=1 Tax=Tritrichomonas musculus TaxID=1915356 RepID=A0ABR2GNN5_9EUKA
MSKIYLTDVDKENPMQSTQERLENEKKKVEIGPDGLPLNVINSEETNTHKHHEEDLVEEVEEEENHELHKTDKEEKTQKKQSTFATIMNIMNSILGAGILSIPNTFVNSGIIPSIILILIMAILSLIATDMVISLAFKTQTVGLAQLTEKILGFWGALILTILNLLFLLTALVAYLVLAGDMITSWFDLGGIDLNPLAYHAIMELIYGIIPISLTIPRDISFLRYFSTATVICVIFFCVVMLYKAIDYHKVNSTVKMSKLDISLFSSVSIYGLSFALPSVVLPAVKLYTTKVKRRWFVSMIGIIIALFFYAIPGVTGYLIFGDETNGNILKNFKSNDVVMIICRACFFIVVTCAYPMIAQTVQAMWSQLIFKMDQPAELPNCKRFLILALTNSIPLIIAMLLPSAKPALSIGGALGGCLVDFAFPSLEFIVLYRKELKWSNWRMISSGLFFVFGLVTGVIATYQSIADAIVAFS